MTNLKSTPGRTAFADWLTARATRDPGAVMRASVIYDDYAAWCDAQGAGTMMTARAFGHALSAVGVKVAARRDGCIMRQGLRLTPNAAPVRRPAPTRLGRVLATLDAVLFPFRVRA